MCRVNISCWFLWLLQSALYKEVLEISTKSTCTGTLDAYNRQIGEKGDNWYRVTAVKSSFPCNDFEKPNVRIMYIKKYNLKIARNS